MNVSNVGAFYLAWDPLIGHHYARRLHNARRLLWIGVVQLVVGLIAIIVWNVLFARSENEFGAVVSSAILVVATLSTMYVALFTNARLQVRAAALLRQAGFAVRRGPDLRSPGALAAWCEHEHVSHADLIDVGQKLK